MKYKYHYTYKITNLFPTDERQYYIGVRSTNITPERDNYWGSSTFLKETMDAEGSINFVKEILTVWSNRTLALAEEIRLHAEFDVAVNPKFYNQSKQTATGFDRTGVTGFHHTDEAKKKMSEAKKGRKYSEETKKKMVEARTGLKRTEECKQRMSALAKKRGITPEHIKKMQGSRIHRTGDEQTEKQKARRKKIGDSLRGRKRGPMTEKQKLKISKSLTGKPGHKPSEETKKLISEAKKVLYSSPAMRQQCIENGRQFSPTYKLIDPAGKSYFVLGLETADGLQDFAKSHDLSFCGLQTILKGKTPRIKKMRAWKCIIFFYGLPRKKS